jgi:regulator of nucleoside diphosphate kinase
MNKIATRPLATIAADDYERLSELVEVTRGTMPEISLYLGQELARASIVTHADPASVQMRSSVRFHDHGSGKVHEVRLVYPADSSPADGRISVLTPVGSALLGRQTGSTALCRNAAGQVRSLTVVSVAPPPRGETSA